MDLNLLFIIHWLNIKENQNTCMLFLEFTMQAFKQNAPTSGIDRGSWLNFKDTQFPVSNNSLFFQIFIITLVYMCV